ncbi:uncharacterized protein BCR38DRAFT_344241 [Pseudomassariella vexata]|uniref:Exonuclease domain-containing protein n=1 Tax=Pseudomassariella vexata TaxID=1141098 RepID=A0A1Y2DUR6_9PEZI|nr:uncharacterized protein BCR38DRAFT_344241 [Pseudomassariella vexata]ORY63020.1 hypothetical protein BCR38DRAFT_344241 [Pseudomassariella vexata]
MLKHLPCPAGKSCTAFKCLFHHGGEDKPTEPSDQNARERQTAASESQDTPRKRMKLTADSSSLFATGSSKQAEPGATEPQAITGMGTLEAKAPSTLKMAISSSTLKHKAPTARSAVTNKGPSVASPKPANAGLGETSSKASPATKPLAKATPKKPETLNPRHLQKAPATHEVRTKLVKALHEQYARLNNELKKDVKDEDARLVMSDQELIVKALDDEQDTAMKKPTLYGNSCKNRILNYKRMSVAKWKEERAASLKAEDGEILEPEEIHKVIETGLTPQQEVDFLPRLVWSLQGLERYGYVSSIPKGEGVKKAKQAVEASGNVEVCDRCNRRFSVFPGRREEDGALTSNGPCVHHPGKTYYLDRRPGDRGKSERRHRCCEQSVGDSDGCTTSSSHVFKTTDANRLASVLNFAETPPNPSVPKDRAVCFDCEMGYTVYGMELIRLTAVSWPSGDELLDILVFPVGEYIDLNTRYSGVRPEDMVQAERWKPGDDASPTIIPSGDPSKPPQRKLKIVSSPKEARDLLFNLISPDTPLIGHGIENDLNAVRIIHPSVVDTVLLYPHKRGLPIRNGLKYLMERELDRKIQIDNSKDQDKVQGHDSAEDARAAGELVRLKIRNEWKSLQLKGWKLEDGVIKAPDN